LEAATDLNESNDNPDLLNPEIKLPAELVNDEATPVTCEAIVLPVSAAKFNGSNAI
jgi:hypothetical protein